MNFKVKNLKTGRIIRDAISGKQWVFETYTHAELWANNLTRNAVMDSKTNTVARFVVVQS